MLMAKQGKQQPAANRPFVRCSQRVGRERECVCACVRAFVFVEAAAPLKLGCTFCPDQQRGLVVDVLTRDGYHSSHSDN